MNNPTLWTPSSDRQAQSLLTNFIRKINLTYNANITTYEELHTWSIEQTAHFWHSVWQFAPVIYQQPPHSIEQSADHLIDFRWFVGSQLNYAENLLRHRGSDIALIEVNEQGKHNTLSFSELTTEVNRLSHYWRAQGIKTGDRIAAMLPNNRYAIIAMLACASIGAVWSCCAPDFGLDNLLDRFSQIKPTFLVVTDEHQYKGRHHHHRDKINTLQRELKPTATLIITTESAADITRDYPNTTRFQDIPSSKEPVTFTPLPFDHPLMILFSSGTTGKPKCIVHSAGGTLLQHLKEHQLHCDIKPLDRVFFYTTTGWMMWNWLISALASEATLVLFDGCPTFQSTDQLFSLIDQYQISHFGVSAKYIELCQKKTCTPKDKFTLSSLNTILSTGSPLLPKAFDYIYNRVKSDVCLSSISGGTDIVSCFALGNPLSPVYRGEIQGRGLGMAVNIFNQHGQPVQNEKGELVCTHAFPSMPLSFHNDSQHQRYRAAYFNIFENVWAHHDYASINNHGGIIIYGRSDTTLNPGGIRIGTAEIYRQVDKVDAVQECMAIGYPINDDEKIILFVVLAPQKNLTNELTNKIKQQIRKGTSVHHVPQQIIAIPELPRTLNGKLAESAVKRILLQQPIDNQLALSNPDSLRHFSTALIDK